MLKTVALATLAATVVLAAYPDRRRMAIAAGGLVVGAVVAWVAYTAW